MEVNLAQTTQCCRDVFEVQRYQSVPAIETKQTMLTIVPKRKKLLFFVCVPTDWNKQHQNALLREHPRSKKNTEQTYRFPRFGARLFLDHHFTPEYVEKHQRKCNCHRVISSSCNPVYKFGHQWVQSKNPSGKIARSSVSSTRANEANRQMLSRCQHNEWI